MIKIGMVIGDRYEMLERIGTGGMSDVYKAKDHKLNRFVAVKVLKQEFSENANFVSKFRIEAQAAAGLMHPNIVNVYDVGEENGIYYIVMELVDGITLKKYIEKKARLSYKEAVSIAIQVSMGIEAAHNNHIIHRDIKPQNIIISREGKVKVTDFGIAKAATSNTITSNVMGSVHYTSPEQARGGYSDEKSDIYSLGITMFEMLTGRVPFNGETTVAIAIKHIQEELPSPAEFVPEIPGSVESIVLKCCQKSPDRRYQNIQELVADLKQSLMNPDENFVVQSDPDMDGETRMITDSDMVQIKRRAAYQEYEEQESMRLRSDAEAMYDNSETPGDEEDYDYNPKMERVTTLLAVLAGVVICVIVIILAINVFGNREEKPDDGTGSLILPDDEPTEAPEEEDTVEMPPVIGETVENARNILKSKGIESEVWYEESSTVEIGIVMRADVNSGDEIPVGSTVTLFASAGPEGIDVPDVRGKSYEEAESMLRSQGFSVTKIEGYNDTYTAGYVITQIPAGGSTAPEGTEITLTVSLGQQDSRVPVPNLMGMTEMDAEVTLREHGLKVGNVDHEFNSQYPEGQVFYQSYSLNTPVDPGTSVDIKVSRGPEPAPATYKYNGSIQAPAEAEASGYKTGTSVALKLVADDGAVLLDNTVTSFPHSVNFSGIKSSGGTLTMTFTVEVAGEPTEDTDGEPVAGETTTEVRTVTRRIEFTQE